MRTGGLSLAARAAAVAALLVASAARGDTVVRRDGTSVSGAVSAVEAAALVLDGKSVPLAEVRQVTFAREPVAPYPGSLVLRDGTRLCGVFRGLADGLCVYRSVSLGALRVPVADVAALNFTADPPAGGAAPPAGQLLVVYRKGAPRTGRLVAWAEVNLLLECGTDLVKVPLTDLRAVVFAAAPALPRLTLRNGDAINLPVTWQRTAFACTIGETTARVPLAAVATFSPAAGPPAGPPK